MANTVANLTAVLQMNNTKFKQGLSGAEKAMKVFKAQMMALSGAIAGAFSVQAIIQFTRASFNALDEARKAETQLLVALNGREDAQGRLIAQAKELQKTTLFADDDTVRAQALIAAFTKEESQIKRIIPLVQDFAQAQGMDLDSAAKLVSKTLGSTTNAMSRYGISVEGAVGSSERLETLVNSLTMAFGGQAKAAAEVDVTFTKLKNSWNDFMESFAKFLAGQNPIDVKLRELSSSLDPYTRGFFPLINLESGTQNAINQISVMFTELPRDIKQAEINVKELFKTADNFNFQSSGLWAMSEAIGEMKGSNMGPAHPTATMPGMDYYMNNLKPSLWDFQEENKALKEFSDNLDLIEDTEEDIIEDQETMTAVAQWQEWAKAIAAGTKNLKETKWEMMELEEKAAAIGRGFAALGQTINQIAKGAEQSFEDTAQTLLDTIGQVLISIGGWAALVGGILVGGSALWDAFEAEDAAAISNSSGGGNGTVTFKIEGRDLVGVLNTEQSVRGITT